MNSIRQNAEQAASSQQDMTPACWREWDRGWRYSNEPIKSRRIQALFTEPLTRHSTPDAWRITTANGWVYFDDHPGLQMSQALYSHVGFAPIDSMATTEGQNQQLKHSAICVSSEDREFISEALSESIRNPAGDMTESIVEDAIKLLSKCPPAKFLEDKAAQLSMLDKIKRLEDGLNIKCREVAHLKSAMITNILAPENALEESKKALYAIGFAMEGLGEPTPTQETAQHKTTEYHIIVTFAIPGVLTQPLEYCWNHLDKSCHDASFSYDAENNVVRARFLRKFSSLSDALSRVTHDLASDIKIAVIKSIEIIPPEQSN